MIQDLLSHPFACGWRDKDGPVRLAWGQKPEAPGGDLSVGFRDFFFPSAKRWGAWEGLPPGGTLAPAQSALVHVFPPVPLEKNLLGPALSEPDEREWNELCGEIERGFSSGAFQKVVPARSRRFPLNKERRARLLAELLPRLFSGPANGTYRFFLRWDNYVFFGATPELLFRREGEGLFVPAIAGTRALSGDPERDRALGEELLANAKERKEHALVVDGIHRSLRGLGLAPASPPEPELLPLRGLVHLFTPVRAEGRHVSSERLIEALHPTAAVGGSPQRRASEFLRVHEPLSRGLFASPLLFRGLGEEVCLVAIRSGLLSPTELHLFAGAGYVPESNPKAEWEETGKKMDTVARLLEEERR